MFSPNKFSGTANNSPLSSDDCALRKRLETGRLLGAGGDGRIGATWLGNRDCREVMGKRLRKEAPGKDPRTCSKGCCTEDFCVAKKEATTESDIINKNKRQPRARGKTDEKTIP